MNPFDPYPQEITINAFMTSMLIAFLCGAVIAWIIARVFYYRLGKRAGLGMLRRNRMPDNL